MKRMLVAGSIAALALVGSAGAAQAAPSDAACFGQVHKTVNGGGVENIANVGQLVKAVGGGAAKNALANDAFCS